MKTLISNSASPGKEATDLPRLLGGCCGVVRVLVLAATLQLASMAAGAQQAQQRTEAERLDEVIVSGSRVISDNLVAPTPITAVQVDELQNATPGNLVLGLQQLPTLSIIGPASANIGGSSGTHGSSLLSLRNVGAQRTLVMLDGRRIVPQSHLGSPDVSLIPLQLIKRVDVVTGGASAAYGSDAVSGVVNFILDTTYEGLKGEFQGGASEQGDKENYKASLAAGTGFAGTRGHLIAAAEYSEDDGVLWADRSWARESWAVLTNPNSTPATRSPTNPARLLVPNARLANGSLGGLITSGPLAGTQFGAGGVPQPFQFGALRAGATMQGGDGPNASGGSNLYTPQEEIRAFAHASYAITDGFTAFVEGSYGENEFTIFSFPNWQTGNQQFTIFRDNFFLPQPIRDQMTALNLQSFTMGRLSPDMGPMQVNAGNTTTRFVLGARSTFGDGWTFDAHYTHGENDHRTRTPFDTIQRNLYRAADAVVNPATGGAACRTTLQNPGSTNPEVRDCVPINLFGPGSPSPEALNYVLGNSTADSTVKQDAAAVAIRGAPFSIWAGRVAVAVGSEYRKESVDLVSDPISGSVVQTADIAGMPASLNGKVGGYNLTNIQPISGEFDVTEAFAEMLVPLARKAAWAESLDLNAGVRYADYNLSGGVTTWKAGFVYQPVSGLRLRATRSRDIRAGNLNELFAAGTSTQPSVSDPFRNNVVTTTIASTAGNPALDPEAANTTTIGLTYQASWLDGFGFSVDWYDIDIQEAITSLPFQTIVDQCFEGNASLCSLISRDPAGVIVFIEGKTLNAASLETSGFDIETSYLRPAWGGNLAFRLLATQTRELVTTILGSPPRDTGGEIANPKWKGTLTMNYERGPLSLFLRERGVGSAKINSTFGPSDIDDNDVPAVFYTDLTGRFRFGAERKMEVFVAVSNLFDEEPPRETGNWFIIGSRVQSGTGQYDMVGRAYTLGFRFSP